MPWIRINDLAVNTDRLTEWRIQADGSLWTPYFTVKGELATAWEAALMSACDPAIYRRTDGRETPEQARTREAQERREARLRGMQNEVP